MARTAGDVGVPMDQRWPPPGWVRARCIGAVAWRSPKKKTPAAMLSWRTPDGQFEFDDPVFVTGKAVRRLNLVALRICGMDEARELPEDDGEAAKVLGRYICDNALGKDADILIEQQHEQFIYQDGPKLGQTGVKIRSKVAFSGYRVPTGAPPSPQPPAVEPGCEEPDPDEWGNDDPDSIPF